MKLKHLTIKYLIAAFVALSSMAFSSCDDGFFDYEGDCTVRYYINFLYTLNMKNADAFPSEVESVNLYAFDENGLFVKEFTDAGEVLAEPGYLMPLDLTPGQYTFVGWCGLKNEDGVQSFSVPEPVAGKTTLQELNCWLNASKTKAQTEYSDSKLHFLYHGLIEAYLPAYEEIEGEKLDYYYTMPLTKDTNHIRIILQELTVSSEEMEPEDYDFDIVAVNGEMLYDNAIAPSSPSVFYTPWTKFSDYLGIGSLNENDGEMKRNKGIIADFMTSRLMADQQDTSFLTITNSKNGKVIATVPYMQYALIGKEYFQETYKWAKDMTDQEMLDRMDEYELTFFLEKGQWVGVAVKILEWRVVLQDYDMNF